MGKDHADRDRIIWIGWISEGKRKIEVDIVIELEESLVIELHEGGAGDGLGNRGDDVDGLGGRWFLFFQVRIAVRILPKHGCIMDEAGGHPWVVTDL